MKKIVAIDSLRGFAALYVFLGHVILMYDRTAGWSLLFRFGQEAVMLFFLVSGFVIIYTMELARDKSFSSYLGRRFFRIYPIFLLSLFLGYALSRRGSFGVADLFGNVAMLQDFGDAKPGVLFDTYAGNTPLWSLSYEWWFYLMFFPLYRFVAERWQLVGVTAIGLIAIAAYNATYFQPLLFLAYFPIWWSGAEIGRAAARQAPLPLARSAMALGAVTAAFAVFVAIAVAKGQPMALGVHPVLELRHAGASLAMVALLYAYQRSPIKLEWMLAPFSIVAPISYGVYALHFPVVDSAFADGLPAAARVPAVIAAVLAIAWVAEVPYQRTVLRLRTVWRARGLIAVSN